MVFNILMSRQNVAINVFLNLVIDNIFSYMTLLIWNYYYDPVNQAVNRTILNKIAINWQILPPDDFAMIIAYMQVLFYEGCLFFKMRVFNVRYKLYSLSYRLYTV